MRTPSVTTAHLRRAGITLSVILAACGNGVGTDSTPSTGSTSDTGSAGASAKALGGGARFPYLVPNRPDPLMANLAIPADAAQKGMWGPSIQGSFGLNALHVSVLPTGQVLSYGTSKVAAWIQDGRTLDIWDPALGLQPAAHYAFPNVQAVNSFCGAGQLMRDGTMLLSGGFSNNPGVPWSSGQGSTVLDPVNFQERRLDADMAASRWYASMITLGDGRMLMLGGGGADQYDTYYLVDAFAHANDPNVQNHISTTPEVYQIGKGWSSLFGAKSAVAYGAEANRAWYPRAWQAPNGRVFGITTDKLWWLDAAGAGRIEIIGNFKQAPYAAGYGTNPATLPNTGPTSTAVMYDVGKVLQVGGNGYFNSYASASSSQATVFNINGNAPVVTETAPMNFGRQWAQSTVLPDGRVLVTGGTSFADNDGPHHMGAAEIWNPKTGKWQLAAATPVYRGYHSTAVLLPNGTVLSAGGGTPGPVLNTDGQIYYPPYLFQAVNGGSVLAPRPRVVSLSARALDYGNVLKAELADGAPVREVALIGLSSVTHSFNTGQRRIPVAFTQAGNQITVTMPNSGNIAPPGYYQLAVLNANGTPAVAPIIAIAAAAPTDAPSLPTATLPVVDNAVPAGNAPATAFQSVNLPEFRLRHTGFLGYLSPINGLTAGVDVPDSSFVVRAGLSNAACYSFESRNFPGYFLRHTGFRLRLDPFDGAALYKADATFCAGKGLAGEGVSLMPVGFPGYYLRHRNFEFWIDPYQDTEDFRNSASFKPVDWGSVTLRSASQPDKVVRHTGFQGFVSPIGPASAEWERLDSSFNVRPGLAGNCTSFESKNFPGYYLRHTAFRVRLDPSDGSPLFKADATWCLVPGLTGAGMSLRSFNFPTHFMHTRPDTSLWIDPQVNNGAYAAEATFLPMGNF